MSAGLQWAEPIAAREWRWRTQELPAVKQLFWLFPKWSLLIGVPALLLVHHLAPMEMPRIALCLVGLAGLLPAYVGVYAWIICKSGKKHSIMNKGLHLAYTGKVVYPWKNVENYRIVKHSGLPDMRVLEFKMKHSRRVHQWAFSPFRISERELEKAMQKHLGQRLFT